MNTVLVIGFIVLFLNLIIQFARQEHVQDYYDDVICDIEGRLDWGCTRTFFPLGMKAQLEVSGELLSKAKILWKKNEWNKAYRLALQSQEAMNKAQNIYCSAIKRSVSG